MSNRARRPHLNPLRRPAANPRLWHLDPQIDFLNHGSFGACPKPVLAFQQGIQERLEREPVKFYVDDLEKLSDTARRSLAHFLGAKADDLVFVPNATSGVNAVLRSLKFKRGDELLVTDYEYNACRNILNFVAEHCGAKVVVVSLPFPVKSPEQLVETILARVTRRTRLALLDHVTSQTAVIMPMEQLVCELDARGVDTLVDGAHAPGMIDLDLQKLGAAYYTGNCHKWLCAPKGAAFLHVRRDKQRLIRPTTISHGANSARTDRSRFLIEFGWMGTTDPTAALSVSESLRFMATLLPGGWPAIRARNHALAIAARDLICDTLAIAPPCPNEMIGSMAAFPIPDFPKRELMNLALSPEPLRGRLLKEFGIEVLDAVARTTQAAVADFGATLQFPSPIRTAGLGAGSGVQSPARVNSACFKAIAAMSLNRVIGAGNKIPWHLPADFKWFKQVTTGHVVVMGRKTFESIGKPLPNRETIVLSRGQFAFSGVRTARSLDELPSLTAGREVFIAGGAEIYQQALPLCSDLYLTLVKREVAGDASFPPFEAAFELAETLQDNPDFKILHYRKRAL